MSKPPKGTLDEIEVVEDYEAVEIANDEAEK